MEVYKTTNLSLPIRCLASRNTITESQLPKENCTFGGPEKAVI
jgi:hypothetical protein